jgi:hypothetical protein
MADERIGCTSVSRCKGDDSGWRTKRTEVGGGDRSNNDSQVIENPMHRIDAQLIDRETGRIEMG